MALKNIVDLICKEVENKDIKKVDKLLDELDKYENLRILDIYPFQVLDNDKFSQVEVFFDKLEINDFQKKTQEFYSYFKSLEKFEKFFELIWLRKNEFYAFYFLPETFYKDEMYYKFYEKQWKKITPENFQQLNLINTQEYSMLMSLVKLSVSDHLDLYFIIPEEKIIFRGNGLGFIIYCDPIFNLGLFEKIANTEGLYIR
jgi:hypothetical protein